MRSPDNTSHAAPTPVSDEAADVAFDLIAGEKTPALARHLVRRVAEGFPQELVDRAELVTSELVTNAVIHGSAPDSVVSLGLRRSDGQLVVVVADSGHGDPAGHGGAGGFGLDIVRQLSKAMHVDRKAGWTVTATLVSR